MGAYIKIEGETTAKWLERLIAIGAPADVRADVRTILASETAGIFPSISILIFILFSCNSNAISQGAGTGKNFCSYFG